jgi:hypothetical protein
MDGGPTISIPAKALCPRTQKITTDRCDQFQCSRLGIFTASVLYVFFRRFNLRQRLGHTRRGKNLLDLPPDNLKRFNFIAGVRKK